MGVQRRCVPHLKGLISGKVEPKDQGRGGTINLCHAHLKKAILHLKTAIVRIFFGLSVYTPNQNPFVSQQPLKI